MVEKITKWKLEIIGLYRGNYLLTLHAREMAKRLNTSHVTLLPHLAALEKDRILESRRVGKNKMYSLNMTNIAAREHIVLAEKIKTLEFLEKVFLIKKTHSDITKMNLQGCFIIFGSYAKGYFTKESDIDLFYIGEITKKQIEEIEHLGQIYNKKISIKKSAMPNFEKGLRAKDPLIREIVQDHYVLQNAEMFVNSLWRYFNEIRQA